MLGNAHYQIETYGLSSQLCDDTSFYTFYNECASCMATYADESTATEYLSSAFAEALDYCNPTPVSDTAATTTDFDSYILLPPHGRQRHMQIS